MPSNEELIRLVQRVEILEAQAASLESRMRQNEQADAAQNVQLGMLQGAVSQSFTDLVTSRDSIVDKLVAALKPTTP